MTLFVTTLIQSIHCTGTVITVSVQEIKGCFGMGAVYGHVPIVYQTYCT
jgi:hypothetical protein